MARAHKSRHAAHHSRRHGAKTKARRAKAEIKKAGVRSAVHHGSFHTVNAPKGY